MSSSFLSDPGFLRGQSGPKEWLAYWWQPKQFGGDRRAARFVTLERKGGSSSRKRFETESFTGTFMGVVDNFADHLESALGHKHVLVPLGVPDITQEQAHTVLHQVARQWRSGGNNTGAMTDHNVWGTYYDAIQCLVFDAGTAAWHTKSADAKFQHMLALTGLVRTFAVLHAKAKTDMPSCVGVTEALVQTPGVNDMLQKGLAILFAGATWTRQDQLEMLEVVVRRSQRHQRADGTSDEVGFGAGPFVLYVLLPILRLVILKASSSLKTDDLAREVLERFQREGERVGKVLGGTGSRLDINAEALSALTTAAWDGSPITVPEARRLLDFCEANRDMSAVAPWAEWGMLPVTPALECELVTSRLGVGHSDSTFAVRIRAKTPTTFDVISFKGTEWCGFQPKTAGTYTFNAHILGAAAAARGDSRGLRLQANWRVLTGDHVLADDQPSYSLAGMENVGHVSYRGRGGRRSGPPIPYTTYAYQTKTPLAADKPFEVTYREDQSISLTQGGIEFFRSKGQLLIAFQNLWFDVSFAKFVPPPPRVFADPRQSNRSWASMIKG